MTSAPASDTASTYHLHPNDVASVPTRTAEDALRLVPGLVLVQHGSEGKGYQYFLRGFDAVHGADLEVSVDGIPLNELSNVHAQGYLDLGFIPPELIAAVKVDKGPFAIEQGAFALAGAARYELGVAPTELGLRAGYTIGTTLRQRVLVSYSPRQGDGNQFVAVEMMDDPSYGEARHARRLSALGRVHLLDDRDKGRLSLLGAAYAADFGLPGTVRPEDVRANRLGFYDAYFDAGEGGSQRGLIALDYALERPRYELRARTFAGYRRLRLFENFTGYLYDPEDVDETFSFDDPERGDYRLQRHAAWSFGGDLRGRGHPASDWTITAGAGLRGDTLTQREDRAGRDGEAREQRRGLAGTQLLGNARGSLSYRPHWAVQLEAGARVDALGVRVEDELGNSEARTSVLWNVAPRARASFRVARPLRLTAAYGRGFRPPEARALTSQQAPAVGVSEEAARPSSPRFTRTHSVELGTRYRPVAWLSTALTGFATLISRESIFDHVSGLNLELNGTRRMGGELVLSASPLPWLQLMADVSAVDARFRESGRRVPLAPWLTSGARVVLSHPSGFDAGLRFLAVAPRPLPHGARGAALYVFDATCGYRYRWFSVDLALENLLSRELRDGEYHFASHWPGDTERSRLPTLQYMAGPPFNARLTLALVF